MTVQSWAPGHATLFFGVPKSYDNPAKMGSIGGGINFGIGVTTSVTISETTQVLWNNYQITGNVTKTVIELFQEMHNLDVALFVNHESKLKTGHGFSTSGAGAIGTALGLNTLFDTKMNDIELFELAHKAEIINQTGLGSVVGQVTGGIEIRLSQGGPKLSETISIRSNAEIIIGMLGPLSTKDVLTSKDQMNLVTKSGISSVNQLKKIANPSIIQIIQTGRVFMETCGLLTPRIKNMIAKLDSIGELHSTMAMIGEALIIHPKNKNRVLKLLEENNVECLDTVVSNKLPHVLI